MDQSTVGHLEFTGERMMPGVSDLTTFWEHIYRYRFARRFVLRKRVLDIASGEGYGTASLQRAGASDVTGIDISWEACVHAHDNYDVGVCQGDAMRIPLADSCVDVIVSFETVEHVPNPAAFLDECARILSKRGRLIVSTPVKEVYRAAGRSSEFHCSEMSQEEFLALLKPRFSRIRLYSQQPQRISWLSLRPLALVSSPWLRIRGGWRMRQSLLKKTSPFGDSRSDYRSSPVDLIMQDDGWACQMANPFCVVRIPSFSKEESMYMLAVARP